MLYSALLVHAWGTYPSSVLCPRGESPELDLVLRAGLERAAALDPLDLQQGCVIGWGMICYVTYRQMIGWGMI